MPVELPPPTNSRDGAQITHPNLEDCDGGKSIADTARSKGVDPSLYALAGDDLRFFKAQTGIEDDEELKEHVLAVQKEAYQVRLFDFSAACGCVNLGSTADLAVPLHLLVQLHSVCSRCIDVFGWLKDLARSRVAKFPIFKEAIALAQDKDALFLDLACCCAS